MYGCAPFDDAPRFEPIRWPDTLVACSTCKRLKKFADECPFCSLGTFANPEFAVPASKVCPTHFQFHDASKPCPTCDAEARATKAEKALEACQARQDTLAYGNKVLSDKLAAEKELREAETELRVAEQATASQLDKELSAVRQSMAAKIGDMTSANAHIWSIEADLGKAHGEIASLTMQLDELREDHEKLKRGGSKTVVDNLTERLSDMGSRLNAALLQLESGENRVKRVESLEREIGRRARELHDADTEIRRLTDELESAQANNDDLLNALSDEEAKSAWLRKRLDRVLAKKASDAEQLERIELLLGLVASQIVDKKIPDYTGLFNTNREPVVTLESILKMGDEELQKLADAKPFTATHETCNPSLCEEAHPHYQAPEDRFRESLPVKTFAVGYDPASKDGDHSYTVTMVIGGKTFSMDAVDLKVSSEVDNGR
jgi:predicted  nucleic acid-binding Zn-ribbon protein